jgi:hypothetical protein
MSEEVNLVEIWKNTTNGMRWCKQHDKAGAEGTKIVQGQRTFSITPLDRQLNQDIAANAELDLFRNGTFVLVRAADDTDEDEIQSPDSVTEGEIAALSMEVTAEPALVDKLLKGINSPVALSRILEQFVVDDVPKEVIEYVKMKKAKFDPSVTPSAVRTVVAQAEPDAPVTTPRQGIPEADTPDYVMTQPEKIGG